MESTLWVLTYFLQWWCILSSVKSKWYLNCIPRGICEGIPHLCQCCMVFVCEVCVFGVYVCCVCVCVCVCCVCVCLCCDITNTEQQLQVVPVLSGLAMRQAHSGVRGFCDD